MTDFELFYLVAQFQEVSMMAAGIFITVISGFLVMAYSVGARLTRRQTWLVTPLFTIFASMALFGAVGYDALSDRFYPAVWRDPDRQPFSIINASEPISTTHLTLVIGTLIILGALLFLRDVRVKAAQDRASGSSETKRPNSE